jgi:rfaE bifunctional protein kinase chain/domain
MGLADELSKARLEEILHLLPDRTIGVVGDLGLDAYWYADMTVSVISRETPLFPRPVMREEYSPGAGANVAHNLKVLGVGQVVALSVLGDDWRGQILRREMAARGIDVGQLITSPLRSTTTFVKPILLGHNSEQEDARIDFENAGPLDPALQDQLTGVINQVAPSLDALLIADQLDVNGIVTGQVRETLNKLAATHPDKVFVADSRQHIGRYRGVVLKPNWVEASSAVFPGRDARSVPREELAEIGQALCDRTGRPTFITLSEDGVLVCAEGTQRLIPAGPVKPPLDPVGAGDAFIAALAASLSAGASPWEAGAVANLAAAVTVEKLNQTGTASPNEVLARLAMLGPPGA